MSYARVDVDFAKEVTRGLRRLGIDVWMDVYSITAGKSWARQVAEALDRCAAMVVVMSPASMSSENSDDEWNYYLDKKRPVIPVLHETCDIPYRLNKLQYVDFVAQPKDQALTKLCAAIRGATSPSMAAGRPDADPTRGTPAPPGRPRSRTGVRADDTRRRRPRR
jgi:hypothetical protein